MIFYLNNNSGINKERAFLFIPCVLLLVIILSSYSNKAYATVSQSDLSTQTCDANYYESLKSKAWLEAQRRTRQAQNYIRKPDSVLDYNCFTILNNIAAEETEQIFSESHAGHCFPDSLDCSLDRLVIRALTTYFGSNFNHTFLGGRSNLSRAAYDPDDLTMCTVMRDVWQLAKCQNFMPEADVDGFLSFTDYSSVDPRLLPEPCAAPYPENSGTDWAGQIENAYRPTGASSWNTQLLGAVAAVETSFNEFLNTGDAAPGCGDFIPTGVIVYSRASRFYRVPEPDGICSNPACSPNNALTCVPMTF